MTGPAEAGSRAASGTGADVLTRAWQAALGCLPIVLVMPVIFDHYYRAHRPGFASRLFEFFGFWAAFAIIAAAFWAARRTRSAPVRALPVLGFAIVLLAAVQQVAVTSGPTWDFDTYRRAATAISQHADPYADASYTYPPLYARSMAVTASVMARAGASDQGWPAVFYLVQVLEVALVGAVYVLLFRAAVFWKLSAPIATLIVAAILAINVPINLTIANSQVNILLLVLTLGAMFLVGRADWLAGLAIALGALIKVYPGFVLPAWLIAGQRRVVGWTVFWTAVIVATTAPLELWLGFLKLWMSPRPYPRVSDSTLFNLLANGPRLAGLLPAGTPPAWVKDIWLVCVVAILVWGFHRFRARAAESRARLNVSRLDGAALFGLTAEALAMGLLVSPLVWPHHFVYVLPLIVFAFASLPAPRWIGTTTATIAIVAVPWIDLFFVGFHRLAGMIFLLYETRLAKRRPDAP